MKCHYPTLWHALKPSCDCAISQVRQLEEKKAALTSAPALSPPAGCCVLVELVLCLCCRGAAEELQRSCSLPWGCPGGHHLCCSPSEQIFALGSLCWCLPCWCHLARLGSGWFCTMQALALLCLRCVIVGMCSQELNSISFAPLRLQRSQPSVLTHRSCHPRRATQNPVFERGELLGCPEMQGPVPSLSPAGLSPLFHRLCVLANTKY